MGLVAIVGIQVKLREGGEALATRPQFQNLHEPEPLCTVRRLAAAHTSGAMTFPIRITISLSPLLNEIISRVQK